jgi:hypothetical protein
MTRPIHAYPGHLFVERLLAEHRPHLLERTAGGFPIAQEFVDHGTFMAEHPGGQTRAEMVRRTSEYQVFYAKVPAGRVGAVVQTAKRAVEQIADPYFNVGVFSKPHDTPGHELVAFLMANAREGPRPSVPSLGSIGADDVFRPDETEKGVARYRDTRRAMKSNMRTALELWASRPAPR